MKKTLLTIAGIICAFFSNAQLNYTFDASNEPYVSLDSGATSVNGTNTWDISSHYVVPIPFSFKINGTSTTQYKMFGGAAITPATDTASNVFISGFSPMDATIVDRGNPVAASESPIRYRTDGESPNRIFKMEYANAGFMAEYGLFGTLSDSMNVQIWIYETSNVVEMRYGTAQVSHTEYFYNGSTPFISFINHINVSDGSNATYYYLKGDPASPVIDSINAVDMTGTEATLTSFPAAGTIYRFTPKQQNTGIRRVGTSASTINIYPTITDNALTIANPQQLKLSYKIITVSGTATDIRGNVQSEAESINLGSLAPGIYFIVLQCEGEILTKKVILR